MILKDNTKEKHFDVRLVHSESTIESGSCCNQYCESLVQPEVVPNKRKLLCKVQWIINREKKIICTGLEAKALRGSKKAIGTKLNAAGQGYNFLKDG